MSKFYKDKDGRAYFLDFPISEDMVEITKAEAEEIASKPTPESEYFWAANELSIADVQINKHQDGDPSSTHSEAEWRDYRVKLRVYASFRDGVYSINGERPSIE